MKTNILNKLMRVIFSLIASVLLLFVMASSAKADNVNAFQVKGLGNYVGKYLTVYYAIGSRASISTEGDQVRMRQVKVKKTIQITSDVVSLPAVDIDRSGLFLPYNIIVFTVHATADFRWVNPDGSAPNGEQATGPTQYSMADSLTKVEFDSLQQSNYQFGELKSNLSNPL